MEKTNVMSEYFSLATYFSHHNLIMQLLDPKNKTLLETKLKEAAQYTFNLKDYHINRSFNDALLSYLRDHKVPSLNELLIKKTHLKPGMLLWLETSFYFKGVYNAKSAYDQGKDPSYFTFKTTLEDFDQQVVSGQLNAAHLFSTSSLVALSGKTRKFMAGYIQSVNPGEITLRCVLVGDKMLTEEIARQWDSFSLKVDISAIDEFAKVKETGYKNRNLNVDDNKLIGEAQIKQWLADIIDEGHIEKDWGGEQSDLFTSHLHIDGQPVSAAFLLKGPSKFHPMTAKDLGKNGDQIVRLFDQPADLFILQHCHYVTPAVRKQMEAFSSRFYKLGRYCIIDGIDTQRLLKAYGKI